jgi:hypothetical protein
MLRNIPEERRSHLHSGGSLKSRNAQDYAPWMFLVPFIRLFIRFPPAVKRCCKLIIIVRSAACDFSYSSRL